MKTAPGTNTTALAAASTKMIEEEKIPPKVIKPSVMQTPMIGPSNKLNNFTSDLMMGLVNKKQP